MTYKEAWVELKERLEKAEYELRLLRQKQQDRSFEQQRLDTKLSGLMISLEYMHEVQSSIDDIWNDTTKFISKDTGDYLCIVEYDFANKHEITQRLLHWDGVSWSGMGRDNDVVTYWHDSIDNSNDERCSGCMWPVQKCKCERGDNPNV